MKIIRFLKDILAPKRCYSCNNEWHFLCKKCFLKQDNYTSFCYVCKNKSNRFEVHKECYSWIYFDNLIVLSHYKNKLIKKLIIDFKFYNKKDIWEDFAQFMWTKLLKLNLWILNNNDVLITSVPMNLFRKLKKWYNQSEILALELSKNLWIKYEKNILKRSKNTWQQALLSKKKEVRI